MLRMGGWFWFQAEGGSLYDLNDKSGKWMYFFTDQELAIELCAKAIEEHACYKCKCTDLETIMRLSGVICFYLNGDDIEGHKRIITFMIENNLIRKTKKGKLFDISFKFNEQTSAGEYGADFEGQLKLSQFVDLNSGEWIYEE